MLTDARNVARKTTASDLLHDTIHKVTASHHKLSWVIKPTYTTLKPSPSSTCQNGATWHPKEEEIQECKKNHGYHFLDKNCVILKNFLSREARVNSECFTETRKSPNACLHPVCHTRRKTSEVLLIRDNARPHASVCTTEAITKFRQCWWPLPFSVGVFKSLSILSHWVVFCRVFKFWAKLWSSLKKTRVSFLMWFWPCIVVNMWK